MPNNQQEIWKRDKYIILAKAFAKMIDRDVFVVHCRGLASRVPEYAIIFEDNPYLSRERVTPTGEVWECEEYT